MARPGVVAAPGTAGDFNDFSPALVTGREMPVAGDENNSFSFFKEVQDLFLFRLEADETITRAVELEIAESGNDFNFCSLRFLGLIIPVRHMRLVLNNKGHAPSLPNPDSPASRAHFMFL